MSFLSPIKLIQFVDSKIHTEQSEFVREDVENVRKRKRYEYF